MPPPPAPPVPVPHQPHRLMHGGTQCEYRVYEMGRRLASRPDLALYDSPIDTAQWWDAFLNEFFDDDAHMTIKVLVDERVRVYQLSRLLIARYFRAIVEYGGVSDLYFILRRCAESMGAGVMRLESDQFVQVTNYGRPSLYAKVCTEGNLVVEFTCDELMRVRLWVFTVRKYYEMIPRSALALHHEPAHVDKLMKNVTAGGIAKEAMKVLSFSAILQPMQELMARNKSSAMPPHDCLKAVIFQKWQSINQAQQQQHQQQHQQQQQAPQQPPQGQQMPQQNIQNAQNAQQVSNGNLTFYFRSFFTIYLEIISKSHLKKVKENVT